MPQRTTDKDKNQAQKKINRIQIFDKGNAKLRENPQQYRHAHAGGHPLPHRDIPIPLRIHSQSRLHYTNPAIADSFE